MGLLKKINSGMKKAIEKAENTVEPANGTIEIEPVISDGVADVNELLNSGVEAMNSRKGRKSGKKDEKASVKPENTQPILTHDEFCEQELRRAHEEGRPDPDFDFRNDYFKGQKVFYVQVFTKILKSKRIIPLTLRTIYPRMMVGVEDKAQCVCISYNDKDRIFEHIGAAQTFFDSVDLPEEVDKFSKKDKIDTDENDSSEEVSDESGEAAE